ncbi:MAG: hypothetical protein U9R75_03885 [Candidatus Thermoplasmatota archaeon]|nr:hypothetical protein [Candidatus Thermoplasmatota archaeon]
MGAIGQEESSEEILAPISDVFAVITDINLAHSWGQTDVGVMNFPQEARLHIGQIVEIKPKGMPGGYQVKVRVIHHDGFLELDIIEGPMFGTMRFIVEARPYGTLLKAHLDYRIERIGFSLKWKFSERKKYHSMMSRILTNIKDFSEMRAKQ